MKKESVDLTSGVDGALRRLGSFVPIGLIAYNFFLIEYPRFTSPLFNATSSFVLLIAWSIFTLTMSIKPNMSATRLSVYFYATHLFGISYVLFVGGFSSPTTIAWVVLTTFGFLQYHWKGVSISASALIFTYAIYELFFSTGIENVLYDTVYLIIVGIALATCTFLAYFQERDNVSLASSRKSERHQNDRIMTLINNLADAIISTDKDGIIQVYNASFISLVDTNLSVFARSVDDIVHLKDSDDNEVKLSSLLKKATSLKVEDRYTATVNSEDIRLEITYSPIRSTYHEHEKNREKDGYVVILRDITKAKSLEEERDEFISVVSHELRTPIAITEGSIDNARVIFKKDATKVEIVDKSLEMAHDQIIFLARMVNDLSTLSRAERGVADAAEDIDVLSLAHDLHNEYMPQAKKKGLHFELSAHGDLGHVNVSLLYLQELLQNFITNSIKYTKEGTILLTIEKKQDDVYFAVKDTGIGISKSDQAKIFNKFYRSEDYRTRETGGTGLGLYVAEKLSKKLNTTIHVSSRLNHGSTFSFTLPVSQAKPTSDPAKATP